MGDLLNMDGFFDQFVKISLDLVLQLSVRFSLLANFIGDQIKDGFSALVFNLVLVEQLVAVCFYWDGFQLFLCLFNLELIFHFVH